MSNAGGLKRTCYFIGDQDRLAISHIRGLLDFPSDALVVRYAVRYLDWRLAENPPKTMVETALMLGGREMPQHDQSASNDPDGNKPAEEATNG
jgi:hypothetical protein